MFVPSVEMGNGKESGWGKWLGKVEGKVEGKVGPCCGFDFGSEKWQTSSSLAE